MVLSITDKFNEEYFHQKFSCPDCNEGWEWGRNEPFNYIHGNRIGQILIGEPTRKWITKLCPPCAQKLKDIRIEGRSFE